MKMKKGILFSLAILMTLILVNSCNVLDVEEEITFEMTLHAQTNSPDFEAAELLAADSLSSIIDDYSEKIEDIDLLEVSYRITEVGPTNEANNLNTATLAVADQFGAGQESIATVENQPIAVMTESTLLTLNQAGISRFEELIKNDPHAGIVSYFGNANGAPLDFKVLFEFKIKMRANPL